MKTNHKMRQNSRLLVVLMALLLFIALPGCGVDSPPDNSVESPTGAPTETPADPSPSPSPTETTDPEPDPSPTETGLQANPYTTEDFHLDGQYLTCLAAESIPGIDVSSFQGEIDWQAVRDAGIQFVIIRVGGRGYGQSGVLYSDKKAADNYAGARAAGLKVGAYFFSQAITPEEAAEEAAYVLGLTADWDMDMPIAYDWEYMGEDARTAGVDVQAQAECALAFCRAVEDAGRDAMVYFNQDPAAMEYYLEALLDYPLWVALYSDQMTFPYHFDMWQYTNEGTVPGIAGTVDINVYIPSDPAV